jgi:hypothetical protein
METYGAVNCVMEGYAAVSFYDTVCVDAVEDTGEVAWDQFWWENIMDLPHGSVIQTKGGGSISVFTRPRVFSSSH